MVTDRQVRLLMKGIRREKSLAVAAAKAGMSEKTARKYRDLGKLPGEVRPRHDWRTRQDPFEKVWAEVRGHLEREPGLEARTLFDDLQRQYPGEFADGQLRTLQRRVKTWRALEGPPREVFFPQVHEPGRLCESDFTHMTSLGVTMAGRPFEHLRLPLRADVLELGDGDDLLLGELREPERGAAERAVGPGRRSRRASDGPADGGGAQDRATRRSSRSATRRCCVTTGWRAEDPGGQANENGDVEQSHHRFKRALDQALMLRGSRDFESRETYVAFLQTICWFGCNAGRKAALRRGAGGAALAAGASDWMRASGWWCEWDPSSTIRVQHNVYSVHSRLIGEQVEVRLCAETLEVWYGQRRVEVMPRLRGERKHRIEYRHIIDWLVTQAGRVRELPLPRRPVSHEPVPHGLPTRFGASWARAAAARVSGDPAAGGARERSRRRPCAACTCSIDGETISIAEPVAAIVHEQRSAAVADRGDDR